MKNLTPELITQAKSAKSAEQLLKLADANNVEITETEAKTYFEQLHTNGAIDDDELDLVAGGCGGDSEQTPEVISYKRGDTVQVTNGSRCKKCHTTVGVIAFRPGVSESPITVDTGSGYCVKCSTCNTVILEKFSEDKVVKA